MVLEGFRVFVGVGDVEVSLFVFCGLITYFENRYVDILLRVLEVVI